MEILILASALAALAAARARRAADKAATLRRLDSLTRGQVSIIGAPARRRIYLGRADEALLLAILRENENPRAMWADDRRTA